MASIAALIGLVIFAPANTGVSVWIAFAGKAIVRRFWANAAVA